MPSVTQRMVLQKKTGNMVTGCQLESLLGLFAECFNQVINVALHWKSSEELET